MKDKRADSGYNVGQNGSRHVGHITFLKDEREQVIKTDVCKITENCVPDTDEEKTNFYLVLQPQLIPRYSQMFAPSKLIKINPFLILQFYSSLKSILR